eukprot:366558-Chlamydomonas_euryale.AAC.24
MTKAKSRQAMPSITHEIDRLTKLHDFHAGLSSSAECRTRTYDPGSASQKKEPNMGNTTGGGGGRCQRRQGRGRNHVPAPP